MISIIIPVYNNAPTLSRLAERIDRALVGEELEMLFIDDASRDESLVVLRELAAKDKRIKVLALSRNFGQHPATSAGMYAARGEEILFMDADLQDLPEDIPRLLERLRDKASPVDIVYSIKTERHDTALTRLTSIFFHYVHSRLTNAKSIRGLGTFRAFTKKVLTEMLRYKETNILYGPLMVSMGFSHTFVEVTHMQRAEGKSSYSFFKRLALAISILMRYSDVPYRFFLLFGGGIVLVAFVYALTNILQYFIVGQQLLGGLSVIILLILFFMGATFIALGMLGLYVFQIFQETLRRPRFHVAETINLESELFRLD